MIEPPIPPNNYSKIIMFCEMLSPEMAEWFSKLDVYERELIVIEAYMNMIEKEETKKW